MPKLQSGTIAQLQQHPFFKVTLRYWVKAYLSFITIYWQFADLIIRFFIAQAFLRSGMVKLGNWDTAVLLAREEYPVSWLSAEAAAGTGLAIEVIAPILLITGLLTRPAAMAMTALLVIAHVVYIPTTTNLFLIALLGWYALNGSAKFSLDHFLHNGLKKSALPLSKPLYAVFDFSRQHFAPLWIMVTRIWLAATFFAAAGLFEPPIALASWLPIISLSVVPSTLAVIFGLAFLLGIGSSIIVFFIFLTGVVSMAAGTHPDIVLFPLLWLVLYETKGAGTLSLDNLIERWFDRFVFFKRSTSEEVKNWPHVVVVGAGFGGLAAVNRLRHLPLRITLIDKRNYHLFQPLLYQIATATLSPSDIAITIRSLFREDTNVTVIKAKVKNIQTDAKTVQFETGETLVYDKLVLATGAQHSYFGRDEWGAFAPGLKSIEDGVAVRRSVLSAFEQAELSDDPEKIKRLLRFVVVGAGATGVELAGAIAELARETVSRDFRTFDPAATQVILVQSGPRVLPAFPEELSAKALASLTQLGVDVRTGSRVTSIAADHLMIGDDRIDTETVLWAAGVEASPAAKWLNCEADRAGRVVVDEQLRAQGHDNIFVIGDTASSNAWDGNMVPGLAPAAKQAGLHVARFIQAEMQGDDPPKPFAYSHKGSLATIGKRSAVADFGWVKISGPMAWWLWGMVHVGFLVGLRSRISVTINWLWNYFANQSGARLITEAPPAKK